MFFAQSGSSAIVVAVLYGLFGGSATVAYVDLILRSCPKGLEGYVVHVCVTSMLAGSLLQNILRLITIDKVDREDRLAALDQARDLVGRKAPYSEVLNATASGLGGQLSATCPRRTPLNL